MKRGSKHQLNNKTLLFIAVFTIALFVFPGKIFGASYLVDESASWFYVNGHLRVNFEADVTTDEMEIIFYTGYTIEGYRLYGHLNEPGVDFSVAEGGYYSKPVIDLKCYADPPIVENPLGVTPTQVLSLPCVYQPLTGDGSFWIGEWTGSWLQTLKVYVGESWLNARPDVFFTETPNPPTLEALYPPTGETTNVGLGSFNATGDFSLGTMAWLFLRIEFSTPTTTYSFYSDTFDVDEWEGSYEIPVNLLYADTYDVNYSFVSSPLWVEEGSWVDYSTYKVDIATTTLIVHIGAKPEWLDFIETDYFIGEEPEEGTIQHFIWSVHKFLIDLILPSKEIRVKFVETALKIKTLFPYNYIEVTKNWFSDTGASIEQDPTLEIALFGTAVETIPFSIFDASITIGSQTKPLYAWITTIITYILWYGFLVYTINLIKRIL